MKGSHDMNLSDVPVRRTRRRVETAREQRPDDLGSLLSAKIVGQQSAVGKIVPYVQMFQAGLAPDGRPVGVFLLLGPTGTGKTRTVEALAEVLHGSAKNVLKVDCGEFQMEHEVAKLVGAPPGYLGHRETHPMLSQAKLASVASEKSNISIVLFDEIEKAAPSMTRLLLGILDKATLRLGDNNTVNFERSLIFLTSNLGASAMLKELNNRFGFKADVVPDPEGTSAKLEAITRAAARRQFSPEFMNRIDVSITYEPLGQSSLQLILDQHLIDLQNHILHRLGARGFELRVPQESRLFLLKRGTSSEYGAREIKRTLHRHLTQPLSAMIAEDRIPPGSAVHAEVSDDEDELILRAA
jgi:ATP-dependent Clp protease ATP-binding subunit ClpA